MRWHHYYAAVRWFDVVFALVAITAAAFLGWQWLVIVVVTQFPLGLAVLARWRAHRAAPPEIEPWPGNVDVAAFQDTAWQLDTLRRRIERLPESDREGPRGRGLAAEFRHLYGVLQAQYQGQEVEMPIMEPFPTCPSCGIVGAAAAELDPSGGAWWRTCWECGHRWTEHPS